MAGESIPIDPSTDTSTPSTDAATPTVETFNDRTVTGRDALGRRRIAEDEWDHRAGELLDNVRFEEVARRMLMQQRPFEIAEALGVSTRHIYKILKADGFVDVYNRVRDTIYSNLDGVIFDEKAAPLLRARASTMRAQTVVAEVIEEVRKRIAKGQAKAADMRVAVHAAFGTMDRSQSELANRTVKHEHTTTRLNVTADAREIIRSTIRESGLDLSDLLPPSEPIDVAESTE